MPTILPIQRVFDKTIPEDYGNAEYRQERKLLIAIDEIITQSELENPVVRYFLDAAIVDKYISVFGTDKPAWLTQSEHDNTVTNAVIAIRMAILRKRLNLSLRRFSLALSHSDLYKWFCGINRFALPKVPGKTTVGDLENYLPEHLIDEVERRLGRALIEEKAKILIEPIDFGQCYFDCTCISANIHLPVDWLLFRDSTRTLMKAVARIRKAGLCHRMPVDPHVFISKMNSLCMEMTFAKRKTGSKKLRKGILRKMKKLIKKVNYHALNHLALLESRWQTTKISRRQTEQIIKQITKVTGQLVTVIKLAHERIIGERRVANQDKILSIYEKEVKVIVRHKAGAEVEFGNTLYLAEQANGLIIDWKFYAEQAPADCKMLKDSHKRIFNRLGVEVKLMAGDRGFDSKENREYMENNHIFNAVCPRNPASLIERLEEEEFRDAQKRRSQTEARVGIISNCFCGSPMKQKGFAHRQTHMGLSVLSHNLWVLGRLKIAQEKEQEKAA